MKKPNGFSQEQLYAELDSLRPQKTPEFTESVFNYIKYARENPVPVQWKVIVEKLKERFGIVIQLNTVRSRYATWKSK